MKMAHDSQNGRAKENIKLSHSGPSQLPFSKMLYGPCGHLLGKVWPLGFRLWCLTVSLSLSRWYPGSGVVLDCIDS